MGREGRDRARQRGGKGLEGYGARGKGNQWTPENRYDDPRRDIRDLYDDVQDPAGDDLAWPEFDEENED